MARSFSGNGGAPTQYITSSGAPFTNYPFSISVWAKPGAISGANANFAAYSVSYTLLTGPFVVLYFHAVTPTNVIVSCSDAFGASLQAQGTISISDNTWYHLACVYPGPDSSHAGFLYTNGGDKQTSSTGGANALGAGAQQINQFSAGAEIFGLSANWNFGFLGSVADLAIWNVALTDAEILALSKGARPFQTRETSLKAFMPYDGLQSPEPDLSGNAFNGTLTGSPPLASGPPYMLFTPRWPQFTGVSPIPPLLVPGGFAVSEW